MTCKPSEIDLELDRLQAELERCWGEQKALDSCEQGLKNQRASVRLKKLLDEQVFLQRTWRILFWQDGKYRLQAYPPAERWEDVETIVGRGDYCERIPVTLPNGGAATFRLTSGDDFVFDFPTPDPEQVLKVVWGLGLRVTGLGELEDGIRRQQEALNQRQAVIELFKQALGGPDSPAGGAGR
ncbi:MAG: hypothetical protein WC262_09610 [Bacteroidales bacterium]|jgi:hypothetical protein